MTATTATRKGETMDLIKKALERIEIGCVTTLYGIVVWRKASNSFVAGETINIKATGKRLNDAVQHIYDITRTR